MSQSPSPVGRRAGARRLRSLVTLSLCAALACLWAFSSAGPAQAAPGRPAESVAQQAVQLDSPAVTRIVSVVNASLACAGCAPDGSDIHYPSDGSTFTYYSSGSGAFISPDGAILTADHVVDHSMNNPDDVNFVEKQATPDIAARYSRTQDQALQILQDHPSQVSITFQVAFQKAFLSTAYTGKLPDTKHIYAFPIASVAVSSPVDKQDTAIVRIDTSGITPGPDFPYLTLTNSTVNALDNVTAIAFPADADNVLINTDFTALLDPGSSDVNTINSLLSPSANPGTITKPNEIRSDGTLVYEASSIASNGSSGGPVINDQGQVIGFVDAGPSTDRLTFIIPSAVVAKYVTQAGVSTTATGRFMGQWTHAMGEYNATTSCHWTNAESDLAKLKQQYPTFGGVSSYLAQAKQNATTEACATGGVSTSTSAGGDVAAGLALIGGCAVAGLALVLGVIFLAVALTRRRKRRVPAPVAAAPYAAPYAPPATPYALQAAPPAAPMGYPPAARTCPNGHMVVEGDAVFCPNCGAPLQSAPRQG